MKTAESMSLDVIRVLLLAAQHPKCTNVSMRVHETVASFLNNQKRKELSELEDEGKMEVRIVGSETVFPEHLVMECRDDNGREIRLGR